MSYAKSECLFVLFESFMTRIDHFSSKIAIRRQDSKTVYLDDFGHFETTLYLENQMSYAKSDCLFVVFESFMTRIHHFSSKIAICSQDSKTVYLDDFGHFGLTLYLEKQVSYAKSDCLFVVFESFKTRIDHFSSQITIHR